MSFYEIAMPLVESGFYVMPLRPKTKQAFLEDWPSKASCSRRAVEQWAKEYPDANVAVVARPGGTCFLDDDADGSVAKQILADTGIDITKITFVVKTAKGYHYYFNHSEKSMLLGNAKAAGRFDFQADNKYVVGPGSIHPSGALYEAVNKLRPCEIPDKLVEWIEKNADKQKKFVSAGKDVVMRPLHPDHDFEAICEHYGFDLMGEGPKYLFKACPVKGEPHTAEGAPDFGACALFYDGERIGFSDLADSCAGSSMTFGELLKWLHQNGHKPYEGPIWEEVPLPEGLVEEEPLPAEKSADEVTVKSERERVREAIIDIRNLSAKELKEWQKRQRVSDLIYINLQQTGKLFNVGNVAVYLDKETREATEVVHNGPRFIKLMREYGLYASDKPYIDGVGGDLGGRAVDAPKRDMIGGSYYDVRRHILYINEWDGSILKIDGQGNIVRGRNGDDGLLWHDGVNMKADPLQADLDYIANNPIKSLALPAGSLIKKHILDTIIYDETKGLTTEQSQLLLMASLIGLMFIERIPSYPLVYFTGPGGSMKTSLAQKVGKLLQGQSFAPTPATMDDPKELQNLAINNAFLLLDEANVLKKMQNVLKAIATGASDKRRELYTTAGQRESKYIAKIWLTANTADQSNETVAARMIIIDAAVRPEVNAYRSEFYLRWSEDLRNEIWTELIARLAAAMKALASMDAAGQGDIAVSHRMSSFFAFGMAIARHEGLEPKFKSAMDAMDKRQMAGTVEGNELIPLIERLPVDYNMKPMPNGGFSNMKDAEEWSRILTQMVPDHNVELKRNVSRKNWLVHKFKEAERTLRQAVGLQHKAILTPAKNYKNLYGFTGCKGIVMKHEDDSFVEPAASKPVADTQVPKKAKTCACKGCSHCDPKGDSAFACSRTMRTDHPKCSECRSALPAGLVEKLPAPVATEKSSAKASGAAAPGKSMVNSKLNRVGIFDLDELE